jgi:hypothetical protein
MWYSDKKEKKQKKSEDESRLTCRYSNKVYRQMSNDYFEEESDDDM